MKWTNTRIRAFSCLSGVAMCVMAFMMLMSGEYIFGAMLLGVGFGAVLHWWLPVT